MYKETPMQKVTSDQVLRLTLIVSFLSLTAPLLPVNLLLTHAAELTFVTSPSGAGSVAIFDEESASASEDLYRECKQECWLCSLSRSFFLQVFRQGRETPQNAPLLVLRIVRFIWHKVSLGAAPADPFLI